MDAVLADAPGARLFPPLGEVSVRIELVKEEGESALVRIRGTREEVVVPVELIQTDGERALIKGELLRRASNPGLWFGKRYYGIVQINDVITEVPLGAPGSNNIIAA